MATKPVTLREECALLRRQINEERDARDRAGPSNPAAPVREDLQYGLDPAEKSPLRRRRPQETLWVTTPL